MKAPPKKSAFFLLTSTQGTPAMPFKRNVYESSIYREQAPILGENPFQSMMERFDIAAQMLELDPGFYEYLCTPSRIFITAVPV